MKSTTFSPGQQIGRYRVVRLIAQGGMAEVYRADQELTAGLLRPAALKVIRPEYSESPDFREMFLDEARCACQLSHPHIVHTYEVGEHDGLLYMAMELVPGETLATVNRTLREHQQRFSDEALFAIGIACASALEAVHALELEGTHANLVHRDVSPHNLLLSSKGSLKLIDFGIAKAATNRNLTSPGVTKGKAGYFSPEQAMGKSLDGRSDLFSLGITLYKLAVGHTPFDHHKTHSDRNGALVRGLWEPLQQAMPSLPPRLSEVVTKATAVKPDGRYPDARTMREALEQAAYESGFRVGQSSLLGYVTNDGETAVPNGSRPIVSTQVLPPGERTRAAPETVAAPDPKANSNVPSSSAPPRIVATDADWPPERRRVTDRVEPRDATPSGVGRSRRPPLMWAVVVGAAVVGVVLVVLLLVLNPVRGDRPPPPTPVVQTAPMVVPTRPAPPEPTPTPVVMPTPESPSVPEVGVVDPEPRVEPPKKTEGSTRPVRPTRLSPGRGAPVAVTPPPQVKEPEPESIPSGSGKLRINIQPDNVASRVVVGREDWGPAPVNKVVSSGRYSVVVRLADGRRSPEWRGPVMPETTTVLIYDIAEGRWSKR